MFNELFERIKKNIVDIEAENKERSEMIEDILASIEYEEDLFKREVLYNEEVKIDF